MFGKKKQLIEGNRELSQRLEAAQYSASRYAAIMTDMERALKAIAAQETPYANSTVKRMAKIARDALST